MAYETPTKLLSLTSSICKASVHSVAARHVHDDTPGEIYIVFFSLSVIFSFFFSFPFLLSPSLLYRAGTL